MSQSPLASRIIAWAEAKIEAAPSHPPLLALSGAQGIGKSTAVAALAAHPRLRIATLSLDDVYHTQAARRALAQSVHPLCATRGPPGSHDLALLNTTLTALQSATASSLTPLPRFDKRLDDRTSPSAFKGRPDAILLEGWMVGAHPDATAPTAPPLNALEQDQDPGGIWRAWQEAALENAYASLWPRAAATLHLDAPNWSVVARWRLQQEAALHNTTTQALTPERQRWVTHFIMHFERITRRMLAQHRHPGDRIAVTADRLPA